MSGYQSDIDLKDVNLVGDIPVENTAGGFGQTVGLGNDYVLNLDPPLTAYKAGLSLQVKFHQTNTDTASLNVNGLGNIAIKKIVNNTLQDLEAGDLSLDPIYDLKYDGVQFQMVTLISSGASLEVAGGVTLKGSIDASTSPPFPAAKKGDLYTVTGAGFIGDSDGGDGLAVSIGDIILALEDNEGGDYVTISDQWNGITGKEPPEDQGGGFLLPDT